MVSILCGEGRDLNLLWWSRRRKGNLQLVVAGHKQPTVRHGVVGAVGLGGRYPAS